ncbi:BMP family lipoprotein [Tepidibacter aestuarii]|uniref:BMP family lipoprotein n=1 Tax=Tepidibacter aestuarii TaxID=2925782 RepID=UPI0020C02F8B|nr:BMP family ABC transporter substrate-binding protein [Tepidibacter aestuarii]CAH2212523.1 basic membrane protein A and related proteins [Tepidibacter aestuarii]
MKKKLFKCLSIALVLVTFLVGCGSVTPQESNEDALKVGLVVAGSLGDRSFYDSSNEGLNMAIEKLGIIGKVLECKKDISVYKDQLIQASNISDVVVVMGFEFYDVIQEVAKEFPNKKYIYIDDIIKGVDNIACIDYKENEGSFLAGALAAMKTETGKIGMVGGKDVPVIRNFQIGYEAGAKYINSDIKVETIFAGNFKEPQKGKECALTLYSKGVDIIFQAAGKTGKGVLEAAKDANKLAIGVDVDQRYISPHNIVASMVKAVDLSIFESLEKIQNNGFEAGKVYEYGIKENGVYMSYGSDDMTKLVDDETKAKIDDLSKKIISGEIEVPEVK